MREITLYISLRIDGACAKSMIEFKTLGDIAHYIK
jgi:hypothetical protein